MVHLSNLFAVGNYPSCIVCSLIFLPFTPSPTTSPITSPITLTHQPPFTTHVQSSLHIPSPVTPSPITFPHLSHTILLQFVASGSRVKLYLPKDTCLITFILAGSLVSMATWQCPLVSIVFLPTFAYPCLVSMTTTIVFKTTYPCFYHFQC